MTGARATSIAECFRDAAREHPGRVAVLDDDGPLRYGELARAAGGVAAALTAAGLRPGERAGLLLGHGRSMIAAILGTLAAGGCYVPLDPEYPAQRLAVMAADAAVSVLLTAPGHASLARTLAGARVPVLFPAGIPPGELAPAGADPDGLAYLLYTSGSTGQPKGVAQTHRNVLHGIRNHLANFAITPADRLSLLSSFCFDMAVTDLFAAVLSGAAVVPIDVRSRGLSYLARELAVRGVTIYHSTPTLYQHLVAALDGRRLTRIRAVLLGGEQVTRAHLRAARSHFAPDCVFVNGYGATEVSFAVQCWIRPGEDIGDAIVPIGHPLPGYEVLLLDDTGRAAQRRGEIAIKSSYLAPGYWNDAALTAGRFTTCPDGTRLYRTGDQGMLLADGRLACLGRTDRQVKIRGYRVDLGEVEAHLAALPGVTQAVVVPGRNRERLTGYVVPVPGARPDPGELIRALAGRLPGYLVPAAIVIIGNLPLTPTGKVDLRALPAAPVRMTASQPPVTATERLIATAWCELTGLPEVCADASFFDTGGHSLLLGRLQQRLESALGREVPLSVILTHPTAGGLARWLDSGATAGEELDRVTGRMERRRTAQATRGRR